jgi:sulfoxide reductase heme-binding subunit YedZ
MVTQTQTKRGTSRLEDLLILTIGMTLGGLIALFLLGIVLDNWRRGNFNLGDGLVPLWGWIPPAAREMLINEASTMGWPLTGETAAYWYMSRAAGLMGYLLLWAGTAWGLLVSTKVAKGLVPAPFATSLHEFLSLTALAFSAFHALALLGDHYIDFNLIDIIYPFAASYRPGWVGVGQVGFYLSALLTLSFYVRKTISPKTWRKLHYLTFLTYGMVLVHGLTAGTDVSALPVQIMYVASGAAIVFLIYYRLFTVGQKRSR